MKLLLFTVFLAVMQATPPVPRQAANQQTASGQQIKRDGNGKKRPSQTRTTGDVSERNQAEGQEKSSNNAPQTIIIRESAPVSKTGKDPWDKAYVILTGILVGIGGFGVCYANRTLKQVKRQVDEMVRQRGVMQGQLNAMKEQRATMEGQLASMKSSGEQTAKLIDHAEAQVAALAKSADAAQTAAKAAMGVAIPTLVVHEFGIGEAGAATLEAFFQFPTIKLVVKNYGQTAALLHHWTIVFTCEELPDEPKYFKFPGSGMTLGKAVILPNGSYTLPGIETWNRQGFSAKDAKMIITREKQFSVYGYVAYNDIFGSPLRRMKFCETAVNFGSGMDTPYIGWFDQLCGPAYRGIDYFPVKKKQETDEEERSSENPN